LSYQAGEGVDASAHLVETLAHVDPADNGTYEDND